MPHSAVRGQIDQHHLPFPFLKIQQTFDSCYTMFANPTPTPTAFILLEKKERGMHELLANEVFIFPHSNRVDFSQLTENYLLIIFSFCKPNDFINQVKTTLIYNCAAKETVCLFRKLWPLCSLCVHFGSTVDTQRFVSLTGESVNALES